jgi:hypothetical protein
MIINKPFIEERDSETFLLAVVEDEITNTKEEFYFSVQNEYGKFLCDEISDSFVAAMLIPALMSGQDLYVIGAISEILQHHLENSLVYLLSKVFDKKPIKVIPESTVTIDFDSKAIATGFSGGVDSFATVLQHTSDHCPDLLTLTHLALLNIGAYGNNEERSTRIFREDAQRAEAFADEIALPLVLLNSNISKAYDVNEITHGYTTRLSISLMAGILALQKLFKIYLVASSQTIDKIRLDKWYQTHYENILASCLSTTNTTITIANENMDRIEKTKFIADSELVQKFLYVCLSDILNEKSKIKFNKDAYPNCSECFKCLRTLFVIDLFGKLNDFSDRFDIRKYQDQKVHYIKYVLKRMNKDPYLMEIYEFMIANEYSFPQEVRYRACLVKFKMRFRKFKRKAKRYSYYKLYDPITSLLSQFCKRFSFSSNKQKHKFMITGSRF